MPTVKMQVHVQVKHRGMNGLVKMKAYLPLI